MDEQTREPLTLIDELVCAAATFGIADKHSDLMFRAATALREVPPSFMPEQTRELRDALAELFVAGCGWESEEVARDWFEIQWAGRGKAQWPVLDRVREAAATLREAPSHAELDAEYRRGRAHAAVVLHSDFEAPVPAPVEAPTAQEENLAWSEWSYGRTATVFGAFVAGYRAACCRRTAALTPEAPLKPDVDTIAIMILNAMRPGGFEEADEDGAYEVAEAVAALYRGAPREERAWYTEREMRVHLRGLNYSEQIADELAELWAGHLQKARERALFDAGRFGSTPVLTAGLRFIGTTTQL